MLNLALILLAWSTSVFALPAERRAAGTWTSVGCVVDGSARALDLGPLAPGGMTPAKCQSLCAGYQYAGVQWGSECFCGNTLTDGLGTPAPDSECSAPCQGGGNATCGGFYRMNRKSFADPFDQGLPLMHPAVYQLVTDACPTSPSGSFTPCTPTIAPSTKEKRVWAHHVIANTQNYNAAKWAADIAQATAAQVDGFFLNVGTGSFEAEQVVSAYTAAQSANFKMALSFDMSSLQCTSPGSSQIVNYLQQYVSHPAAAKYNGKSIVTTTGGDQCGEAFWNSLLFNFRNDIAFMPSFGVDPSQLGPYNVDGTVGWNNAWPTSGSEINTARDLAWLQALPNKAYIATVSPVFYSHLASSNLLRRSDNWLFNRRFEQLLSLRDRVDHLLIASWNDYAQSTYIGDLFGTVPSAAADYAKFAHTDVQSLAAFYGNAWHSGAYPAISSDRAWIMSRPHTAYATATNDNLPAPNGRSYTWDNLYAQVHLVSPANVTLCAGTCTTKVGTAGINRFSHPLQVGATPSITVSRHGVRVFGLNLLNSFDNVVPKYNYNYMIASSSHN